jgi:hypothetical protein
MEEFRWRTFRSEPWNREQYDSDNERARDEINRILRKYTLAHRSFKRIGVLFLFVLLLLIIFTIAASTLELRWKVIVGFGVIAIILGIAGGIAPEAYPSPDQIWNLDYLIGHFPNFHPESLIQILNIGVQRTSSPENPSQLCLSCAVHLTGYKFFLVMTNEDQSQRHFISFGKVTGRTKVNQVIFPGHYRWMIPVGDLDPTWPVGLDLPVWVHLFVFIPTPIGWTEEKKMPYFGVGSSHDCFAGRWREFPRT